MQVLQSVPYALWQKQIETVARQRAVGTAMLDDYAMC